MDIEMLRAFFMWCTILNAGLGALTFLAWLSAADFIYKVHSALFPMPRETFNAIYYSFIGLYKVLVFVFNLVPWLALVIIS